MMTPGRRKFRGRRRACAVMARGQPDEYVAERLIARGMNMTPVSRKVVGLLAGALLLAGLICPSAPALPQKHKADQIIEMLTPRIPRSLSPPAPAMSAADRDLIESLRHRTRPLSTRERERVAPITKDRPS